MTIKPKPLSEIPAIETYQPGDTLLSIREGTFRQLQELPQGLQGETGPTGPAGETGPAGPQGFQGIQGPPGSGGGGIITDTYPDPPDPIQGILLNIENLPDIPIRYTQEIDLLFFVYDPFFNLEFIDDQFIGNQFNLDATNPNSGTTVSGISDGDFYDFDATGTGWVRISKQSNDSQVDIKSDIALTVSPQA